MVGVYFLELGLGNFWLSVFMRVLVFGNYVVALLELGFAAILALNLLVGAILFLFSVILLMLGLVSGWGSLN